jgi:hypothetical protein
MAKFERTGWRDLGISQKHRDWGVNVPAVDLDFTLCEYDNCTPVAIIEYKRLNAPAFKPSSANFKTLKNLADMASIMFFVVRYGNMYQDFKVMPANEKAKGFMSERVDMTEYEYKAFLHNIRGRKS